MYEHTMIVITNYMIGKAQGPRGGQGIYGETLCRGPASICGLDVVSARI